jgi:hypothetical protein
MLVNFANGSQSLCFRSIGTSSISKDVQCQQAQVVLLVLILCLSGLQCRYNRVIMRSTSLPAVTQLQCYR